MGDNPFYLRDDTEPEDTAAAVGPRRTPPLSPDYPHPAGHAPALDASAVLRIAQHKVEAFKGSELSFSFPHTGGVFTRLARAELSDFDGLELIDLRMLRAHLEEASFLVANAIARHEQQRR